MKIMKKYYKLNEFVWIKPLKKRGKIQTINVENKEVIISYFVDKNKLSQSKFKFWEIDKLRTQRKPLQIKIKYFDKDMPRVEKINIGDWIDLRAAEDVTYKQGDFNLIPLGVAMELPRGYEANIVPRSSTFKHFGILQTNSFGVVDETYCGNDDQWFFPMLAMRDGEIKKYDRICQFRINRVMPKVENIEVEVLENKNRGGHGSTGIK